MKTKIRTFITVGVIVFAGVLNANATVNSEEKNSGLIRTNESLTVLNEKIASLENELNESVDFGKEAQMITHWIADMEEAKATQRVMERGFVTPVETIDSVENEAGYENNTEVTDFREEAQLMTKLIADKEEVKVIRKVMERGFVAPIETVTSSENENGYENNIEVTDFRKEAQLITKLIADKEEAKVIQKVMERGYVAPVETINSVENEVGYENNIEVTDFRKEAQLTTKLIADKEEARAIQELIAEGRLAEN